MTTKVYAVIRVHSNGFDGWGHVHKLFIDKTAAELEVLEQNEEASKTNHPYDDHSYFCEEYDLL